MITLRPIPGGAFPGPAREMEKNPPPQGAIPVIGSAGVAPRTADAPLEDRGNSHGRSVAPRTVDAPNARRAFFRPVKVVAPCPSEATLDIKGLTITRRGRRLYVNLTFAVEKAHLEPSAEAVGIDMGITDRMTLSTGDVFRRRQVDRARVEDLQRRRSRCKRSELEQTWGLIRQQLTYKAEWAGRELVAVDPRNTSQTCSECGMVDAGSRRGKQFSCTSCGFEGDADVNAAVNILAKIQV